MKKRIISAILSACMLFSSIVAADYTATAVDENQTQNNSTAKYKLADSVDDGVILQAWNWSYANVEKNLEELASLGYTTIQVSPPNVIKAGTKGINAYYGPSGKTGWWMFYQPAGFSLNEKTDNALGTKAELISLTTKAHSMGMKIIADGVINHLGTKEGEIDGYIAEKDTNKNTKERVTKEAQTYAKDILDANAFHTYFSTSYLEWPDQVENYKNKMRGLGFTNYNYNGSNEYHSAYDQTQGSISYLPDLDTSKAVVQNAILNYFKECIDAGIDGFRFDAAKHIETPEDPAGISSKFWDVVIGGANKYAKDTYDKEMFYYGEILNSCGIDRPYSRYLKYMEITDSSTYYGQFGAVDDRNPSKYGSSYSNGMDASNAITWAESHDIYMDYFNHNQSVPTENTINKRWALAAARDNTAMYFARPENIYSNILGDADRTAWASTEVGAVNKFHTEMSGESECISSSGTFAINERGTSGVVIVNCNGNATKIKNLTMKKLKNGIYYDRITGRKFKCEKGKLTGEMGDTGIVVLYKENVTSVSSTEDTGIYATDTKTVKLTAKNVERATYQINGSDPVEYNQGDEITIGKSTDKAGTSYQLIVYGYKNDYIVAANSYIYTKQNANKITFDLNGANWNNVHIYLWGGASGELAAWPGKPMTKNSDGTYSFNINGDYANVIFNNGNDSNKTNDLTYNGSAVYKLNGMNCTITPDEDANAAPFFPDGWAEAKLEPTRNPNGYETGDVTKDYNLSISDVTLIQKSLIKIVELDDEQISLADFNSSDTVNIKDATAIQYKLAGLEY